MMCSHQVGGSFLGHRCARAAKPELDHEGKPYCTLHYPPYVLARASDRAAKPAKKRLRKTRYQGPKRRS